MVVPAHQSNKASTPNLSITP
ncbi:TPA: hypothetical protein I2U02_11245 [Staphylococcus aureus]|nr:hypothetical protein [Staphylococcus aureus]HAR7303703.1 hypothetical protein [Staphylococcus aureus]HAR7404631.1 hypothetical protein [Staphylococcus aureus]HAR7424539.1 hypothetical protein [Staphylococcus aureus]HAR7433256.1 hypothetical protein [Staphylococcus aureus]